MLQMAEFFVFVLIVFTAVWGSRFLNVLLKERLARSERRVAEGDTEALREELDQMAERIGLLEDDVRFFTELQAPKTRTAALPGLADAVAAEPEASPGASGPPAAEPDTSADASGPTAAATDADEGARS